MTDSPDDVQRAMLSEKHRRIGEQAQMAVRDLTAAIALIRKASDRDTLDPNADYVAILSALADARDAAGRHSDAIASTANQEPNPLPVTRIAEAVRVSTNTMRTRLPGIKQGRAEFTPPF